MSTHNETLDNILQNIRNGSVTSVNLSSFDDEEAIDDEEAKALALALKSNSSTITSVELSSNKIGDEGATALAQALKDSNSSIESVVLNFNKIGPTGATALAQALKSNTTITSVLLFNNKIGDGEAEAFAQALKDSNIAIERLDLTHNNIGNVGAKALAEGLKVNKTLTSLVLYENKIGNEGAKALAEGLKVNETLKSLVLDVQRNDTGTAASGIGDEGAIAMAEALKVNKTVRGLYLYLREFGYAGAIAMAEALKANKTMESFHLTFNSKLPETVIAMVEALKFNRSINNLTFKVNDWGDNGRLAFIEALQVNSTIRKLSTNLKIRENKTEYIREHILEFQFIEEYSIAENNAIHELSHIFLEEMKSNFEKEMKEKMKESLPLHLILDIENYFPKVKDHEHVIRISKENSKKQDNPTNTQQHQQKRKNLNKIFHSFKEYLELKLEFWKKIKKYDIERKKELLIPRKLLLQFLQNGDMFFTFLNPDLKKRVIRKLERIIIFEYSNVLDELKNRYQSTQQQMDIQIQKNLRYQDYEKKLFDTYRNQIVEKILEINNKKIKNLQKETQVQTQKQIQIQKKLMQILTKIQILTKQNQSIGNKKQKSQTQNRIKLLDEITKILKFNKTLLEPTEDNKLEENILFYMLPDTVIYKYFDPRNLGKAKDRKRKSKQDQSFSQQQQTLTSGSAKKGKLDTKPDYLTYELKGSSSNGDITLEVVDENGKPELESLKASEKKQRISELIAKGYTEIKPTNKNVQNKRYNELRLS